MCCSSSGNNDCVDGIGTTAADSDYDQSTSADQSMQLVQQQYRDWVSMSTFAFLPRLLHMAVEHDSA